MKKEFTKLLNVQSFLTRIDTFYKYEFCLGYLVRTKRLYGDDEVLSETSLSETIAYYKFYANSPNTRYFTLLNIMLKRLRNQNQGGTY